MKIDVWRSRWAAAGAAIAITFGGGGLFAAHALGTPSDASVLVPVVPVRVLDTRQPASPLHAIGVGGVATLSLADIVSPDATAALINLTVTNGTAASYLTVFPTGGEMPLASSINWANSNPLANSTVIKLGTNKSFDIYNNTGTVDVVIDLVGYWVPAPTGGGSGGPAGPQGPTGPQGAAGAVGATGAKGEAGAQGAQGVPGEVGPQGPQGDQGDTGAAGEQGLKGDTGLTGATGPAGVAGPQGPQGEVGPKGDTGATGEQGLKGDTGLTGATGPAGAAGSQGAKGDTGATGAAGTNGTNGTNGVSGYALVTSTGTTTSGAVITVKAACASGKKAVGGGYVETSGNGIHVVSEGPATTTASNDSWSITAKRIANTNTSITVTAICVIAS